jgi:hypothetical protein
MLKNQIVLPLELLNGNRGMVKLPENIDKETMKIWKLPNGVISVKFPLPIVHGITVFILHSGHDYRIKDNMFSTSNPDIYNNKILVEWGPEVKENCECSAALEDKYSFCIECGTQVERENKLLYINVD